MDCAALLKTGCYTLQMQVSVHSEAKSVIAFTETVLERYASSEYCGAVMSQLPEITAVFECPDSGTCVWLSSRIESAMPSILTSVSGTCILKYA